MQQSEADITSTTFQVELTGKVTAYRRFIYEVEAANGPEALALVQAGGGRLIEEQHLETIDVEDGPKMQVGGVWNINGESAL